MKTAILITAYKNVNQIIDIINYFDDRFNFYIHIDKKSNLNDFDALNQFKNVSIYSIYKINWGSLNHLKAIIYLSNKAFENYNNIYFHLISGQDFPTQPIEKYINLNQNYLQWHQLPSNNWSGNGGLDRYNYFNLYDYINFIKKGKLLSLNNYFISFQKKINLKRENISNLYPEIYGGGTWWSLTRQALEVVITDKSASKFLKRLKGCFCAEEIYFQTILLNSKIKHGIINDNLRYIDWQSNRGGIPALLDSSDFEKIINSNYLFARKFAKSSNQLKDKLIQYNQLKD